LYGFSLVYTGVFDQFSPPPIVPILISKVRITSHLSNVYNCNDISYCKTNLVRLNILHDQTCHKICILWTFCYFWSFSMDFFNSS
jgi:hypothetical protein